MKLTSLCRRTHKDPIVERLILMQQRFTFSTRTAWDLSETELARAIAERRASGLPLLDLTASNPTRCGFAYDEASILAPLGDRESLVYDPDPRGMRRAREAVAGYYADHGAVVSAEDLFLTTSTSEASVRSGR